VIGVLPTLQLRIDANAAEEFTDLLIAQVGSRH
jgi:hypothetical protein